ncbi:VCBS repeat-containing protein [Marivirga sp. S37H4]|uniref:VCBS repeat-containing protein n=1 Tax=Marivirga aurantiaca TaxID=2802615 RepID=A0A934WXR4_9BACT|nr:FG-GAP-like repeat-containing protein [Marivirga aurantiaca]MBK6264766.1 VCBS repeat-containing protein [Marivirga aurantiaca]
MIVRLVIIFIVGSAIAIKAQDMQSIAGSNIPDLGYSKSLWADFDNDGDPDLLIGGDDGLGNYSLTLLLNNGDNTFSSSAQPFDLSNAAFESFDYDNDGDLDLLIAGIDAESVAETSLYENDGNGNFSKLTSFTGLSAAQIHGADLNKDGKIDFIISGLTQDGNIEVIVNLQTPTGWEEKDYNLPALYNGAIHTADFNKNGFADILISGINTNGLYATAVMRYLPEDDAYTEISISGIQNILMQKVAIDDLNQDGYLEITYMGVNSAGDPKTSIISYNGSTFVEKTSHGLTQLKGGALSAADINADGFMDLHMFGLDDDNQRDHQIFLGNGDFTFDNSAIVLPGMINGESNLVDFNNDLLPDLFVTGLSIEKVGNQSASILYNNNFTATNTVPTAPTNLRAYHANDTVMLAWDAPTDDHSIADNLTYEVQLRNEANDIILAAQSDLSDGYFRSSTKTALFTMDSLLLFGIPEDRYYYKVHAIDQSKAGGGFSGELEFVVCEEIFLGADLEICSRDTLRMEVNTVGEKVDWYNGDGDLLSENSKSLEYVVTGDTEIVVKVTNTDLACIKYDTVQVTALDLPVIDLAENTSYCLNDTAIFELDLADHTINWSSLNNSFAPLSGSMLSFKVERKDTIVIEAINQLTFCSQMDTIFIDVWALPESIAIRDTSICSGTELYLEATENQVNWYSAKSGLIAEDQTNISRFFTESDSIFIEKINLNNCSMMDTVVVNVNALPVVGLGVDRQICRKDSTTLEVPGDWALVEWYSKKEGQLTEVSEVLKWAVLQTDTLSVLVTDANGCQNSDTIIIEALSLPDFKLHSDTLACTGSELFFDVGPGFTSVNWYSKNTGTLAEGPRYIFYEVMENDSLFVEVFNNRGCVAYDTFYIEAIDLPFYELQDSSSLCYGDTLSATIENLTDSINWYYGNSLFTTHENALSFVPENSGFLWIETINDFGCTAYDSIYVTVNPLPVLNLGNDRNICKGDEFLVQLNQSFMEVNWYSKHDGFLSSNIDSIQRTATFDDTIWVEVSDEFGCINSDTLKINIIELPVFSLADSINVCIGDSVEISATQYYDSLVWTNQIDAEFSSQSASLKIIPEQSSWFVLTQWNASGCYSQDSIFVNRINLPEVDAGADRLICLNETTIIGSESANENELTYLWTPSEGLNDRHIANPEASPLVSTRYYLEVTNSNGCISTDSIYIEVDPIITVNNGGDRSICLGEPTKLGGSPTASGSAFDYSYQWFPENSLDNANAANPVATPDSTTLYTLVVQAGDCKKDTSYLEVIVNPLPVIEMIADTTLGAGATLELYVSGGTYYYWTPNNSLNDPSIANPIASPLQTTTYQVEVQDVLGCISTSEVTVYVENQLMVPNLFTPNNDGTNDYFRVYAVGVQNIDFKVYTRGGKLLYETSDPREAIEVGWDGSHNGTEQPSGTYVWTLSGNFYDGTPISWQGKNSGVISLIR